jgi:polyisoprenoid-binding protein YceI
LKARGPIEEVIQGENGMRKFAAILAVLLITVSVFADEYVIDKVHSGANFSVRHMMLSNVHGRFSDVSGTINYDEKDVTKSSVTAVIKTASISTDNENRDKDLRSANFFDTDKYPEATFKSTKVEKRGDQLVAIGDLTIKGVTKQVEMPFELVKANTPMGPGIGVNATLKINRQDFGVNYNRTMDNGGLVVGNDVTLELNVEAHPPKKDQPAKK